MFIVMMVNLILDTIYIFSPREGMAIIDNRYRHHPFMFQSSREEMAMETEFSTTLSPPRAACTGDHVLNVQKCEGCFYWKLYSE